MNLESIAPYIQNFGYLAVIVILFCGIVGIPAPEETFMLFIGVLCANHQLNYCFTLGSAFAGVMVGSITSYWIGKIIGKPLINKYGKYIKITPERWDKVEQKFRNHGSVSILFGFYVPGLRQFVPYIAGTSQYPFPYYLILTFLGSTIWVTTFITLGYFVGDRINFVYLLIIAAFLLVVFFLKWMKDRKSSVS
jgi:membrane-associated protein